MRAWGGLGGVLVLALCPGQGPPVPTPPMPLPPVRRCARPPWGVCRGRHPALTAAQSHSHFYLACGVCSDVLLTRVVCARSLGASWRAGVAWKAGAGGWGRVCGLPGSLPRREARGACAWVGPWFCSIRLRVSVVWVACATARSACRGGEGMSGARAPTRHPPRAFAVGAAAMACRGCVRACVPWTVCACVRAYACVWATRLTLVLVRCLDFRTQPARSWPPMTQTGSSCGLVRGRHTPSCHHLLIAVYCQGWQCASRWCAVCVCRVRQGASARWPTRRCLSEPRFPPAPCATPLPPSTPPPRL